MLRFLCDEMLISLGKWLRIAGYDTAILDPKTSDQEILQLAIKENRFLITRDRHFLQMKDPEKLVLFLSSNSLDECAVELKQRVHLNWLYQPFTRCLQCNSSLIETNDQALWERVPPDVVQSSNLWYCPQCDKIYWIGSHTDKMFKQLTFWHNN